MRVESAEWFWQAVDRIYAAAFEGDLFKVAMGLIATAYPKTIVLTVGQDTGKLAGNFLLCQDGPTSIPSSLSAELGPSAGWLRRQWDMDIGRVYSDQDFLSQDVGSDGALGRILLKARQPLDRFLGMVFWRSGTRQIAVEVRYPQFREEDLRPSLKDFLQRISRQLSFAARIVDLRRRLAEADHLAENVLCLIPFPTVLIDSDLRVMQLNSRAEAMMGAGTVLMIAPDGQLHLADPEGDAELAKSVAALRSSLTQRVATMTVAKRPGDAPEILSVVRLSAASLIGRGAAPGLADSSPRFAVICENLAQPVEVSREVLWRLFGLSAKEADLALSLLAGETIGNLAVRHRISKETLRNQLAGVMRKTDTARQQDLVAMLTRLATVNSAI